MSTYSDEQDRLRRKAEADTSAAEASSRQQKKLQAEREQFIANQQAALHRQAQARTESEVHLVQNELRGIERKERAARRELGIKQGSTKQSDIRRIQEHAGTQFARKRTESSLDKLRSKLDGVSGGPRATNNKSDHLRPPGGGLIR